MYKTLLKSHKDFENWKVYNVDNNGNLIPDNLEEKEPKQYPCIILEDDYYGSDFYAFIYLTDFDEYFNGYEKPESPFKLNETVITDDGQMGTVDEIIWSPIDGRYTYNVSFQILGQFVL